MPVSGRVPSIDVLRGFSLLGILVMNIQAFAMPHAAYLNPTVYGSLVGAEGVAWSLGRLLFDFKFISLFSMLFGASLLLARDEAPRRRLAWLIVFGLVHGYLIWLGDVLFTYGVVGLVAVGARGWPVRRLVMVGLSLVFVSSLIPLLGGLFFDHLPSMLLEGLRTHYDGAGVAAEVEAFRGSWLTQLPVRAAVSFDNQVAGTLFDTGWRAGGCMLLGMAAVRARLFEGAVQPWPWVPLAMMLGLLVSGAGLWLQWTTGFSFRSWFFAQTLHELGSLGLAAGMGLGVVWLALRFPTARWVEAVGRLGRVAFTAYLMQSVVGTLVFGGHGMGLYGHWSRVALFVAPFVFWSLQLVLAWAWTSRFRVGPLEAVWRGLSRGDFSMGSGPRASDRARLPNDFA